MGLKREDGRNPPVTFINSCAETKPSRRGAVPAPQRGLVPAAAEGMLELPGVGPPGSGCSDNLERGAVTRVCHPLPITLNVPGPAEGSRKHHSNWQQRRQPAPAQPLCFCNRLWRSALSFHKGSEFAQRCGVIKLLVWGCFFFPLSINICRVVLVLNPLPWHDGPLQVSLGPKDLCLPSSALRASLLPPTETSSSSMATQLRSRQSPLCAARAAEGKAPRVPPQSCWWKSRLRHPTHLPFS